MSEVTKALKGDSGSDSPQVVHLVNGRLETQARSPGCKSTAVFFQLFLKCKSYISYWHVYEELSPIMASYNLNPYWIFGTEI